MTILPKGSIVALVTPMHHNGTIDHTAFEQLIRWHVDQGTAGLVIAGTTGEGITLSFDEKIALIQHAVKIVQGNIPILAGTGTASTETTIQLTAAAKKAGADAALIVTPYYNKPTQEGLYRHYEATAKASQLPIVLYNVPTRTAVDLLPETVSALARLENIIALKEAVSTKERLQTLKTCCPAAFQIFSGDDATAMDFMLQGLAQGVISVTANVAPNAMRQLCKHALSQKKLEATALNETLALLHKNLFLEANPIPAKWALSHLGKIQPHLRLPLTPLNPAHHDALLAAMMSANLLNEQPSCASS